MINLSHITRMKLVNDNLPKDLVLDTYSLPISPYNLVDMCVISQRETGT